MEPEKKRRRSRESVQQLERGSAQVLQDLQEEGVSEEKEEEGKSDEQEKKVKEKKEKEKKEKEKKKEKKEKEKKIEESKESEEKKDKEENEENKEKEQEGKGENEEKEEVKERKEKETEDKEDQEKKEGTEEAENNQQNHHQQKHPNFPPTFAPSPFTPAPFPSSPFPSSPFPSSPYAPPPFPTSSPFPTPVPIPPSYPPNSLNYPYVPTPPSYPARGWGEAEGRKRKREEEVWRVDKRKQLQGKLDKILRNLDALEGTYDKILEIFPDDDKTSFPKREEKKAAEALASSEEMKSQLLQVTEEVALLLKPYENRPFCAPLFNFIPHPFIPPSSSSSVPSPLQQSPSLHSSLQQFLPETSLFVSLCQGRLKAMETAQEIAVQEPQNDDNQDDSETFTSPLWEVLKNNKEEEQQQEKQQKEKQQQEKQEQEKQEQEKQEQEKTSQLEDSDDDDKPRRKKLSHPVSRLLLEWLWENRENPYPTQEEKAELMAKTGITLTQLTNWFSNARRRILKITKNDSGKRKYAKGRRAVPTAPDFSFSASFSQV